MSDWRPTKEFRWYRPKGGTDNDKVLQQRWMPREGGVFDPSGGEWRDVPTVLED